MSEPSAFVNGDLPRFYWIGIVFPDGWFIQTGYMDAAAGMGFGTCQSGFSTFTTVLLDNQWVDSDGYYNTTHCDLSGAHYFKLQAISRNSTVSTWQAFLDGDAFGRTFSLPYEDYMFERIDGQVVSEIANTKSQKLSSSSPFPTVQYDSAIQFQDSGSSTWEDSDNGKAIIGGPSYNCDWFTEVVVSADDIKTGKPAALGSSPCHSYGDKLW